jgi:hypothetical protein
MILVIDEDPAKSISSSWSGPVLSSYCKRPILRLASSKILTLHPPHSPANVCPPFWCGGRIHFPVGEGGGGSIFWKVSDTALYSTYVSTLRVQISLKDSYLRNLTHWGRLLYADDDDFVVFIRHLLHVCLSRASKKVCGPRNLLAEFQQNCCKGEKGTEFSYRWI